MLFLLIHFLFHEVVNSKLNIVALVVTSGQAMNQLTDRH